jgi:endonuclease YncB( thermonuclease family)
MSVTGRALLWLIALAGLALGANAQPRPGETMQAKKVVAAASATAFAVLDADDKLRRVKLTGVDAPERDQRFARQAQQLAAQHLGAGPLAIAIDAVDGEQRIHGRPQVDGLDLGLVLIEAGLAWCDPADMESLPGKLRTAYEQACTQARAQRRGLWQDAHPVPPWEHRKIPRFDPPPTQPSAARQCREIGYQTVQCDDGVTYRNVGSQVYGSDGTIYSRRGNTVTGSDGNRYEQRGSSVYGTDGSVCRSRGRLIDCR